MLGSFTEPVEFNGLILGDIFEHIFIFFNFYFYFILLYNTVLVLPYIDMNPPREESFLYTILDMCRERWYTFSII